MNKNLCKALARMARDGDVETVAEIIGEMIDPAEQELPELPAEPEETPADEPAGTEETKNIIIDGEGLAGLLERLDRIIALLAPAAEDEEAAREMEELLEEALNRGGGEEEPSLPGELSAGMEELPDPAFPDPVDEEEISRIMEEQRTNDAVYTALVAVKPVLDRLPGKLRLRLARDIAVRIRKPVRSSTGDRGLYRSLYTFGCRTAPGSAELGKRIMEKRNSAYAGIRAGH